MGANTAFFFTLVGGVPAGAFVYSDLPQYAVALGVALSSALSAALILMLPETVSCALLLGHNPGWEHLVEALTGKAIAMEPATAVVVSQELNSWRDAASAGQWELEDVILPGLPPAED